MILLLGVRVIHIKVNIQVGLLQDKLNEHALLLVVFFVQVLELDLALSFFLSTLVVHFIDFTDERFHVVLILVNLITLFPQLEVRVEKKLEESSDAGASSFQGLYVGEDNGID